MGNYLTTNRKFVYVILSLLLTFIIVLAYFFEQKLLAENMWITVVLGLGAIYVTGNVAQRNIESKSKQAKENNEPISEQPIE